MILMNYSEFNQPQKWYVNGVLAKYMDTYIREHLIWTPEQMYHDLINYLTSNHKKGWYGKKTYIDGEWVFINKAEELWLVSKDAEAHIMEVFTRKYKKNLKLARTKGPLIDRLRFGYRWDDNLFYDINYGLQKGSHNYKKTDIVEGETLIPWTIEHVNAELSGYDIDLPTVLTKLSRSPIEQLFYKHWLDKYYSLDHSLPALIPEICGTRAMFWAKKYRDTYYLKTSDIPRKLWSDDHIPRSVNIRFDFVIINWYKQKMLFIELDGHEYHKTVEQRSQDAIKRSIATNHGFQLNVYTGTQINRNIEACFDSIKNFLEKD